MSTGAWHSVSLSRPRQDEHKHRNPTSSPRDAAAARADDKAVGLSQARGAILAQRLAIFSLVGIIDGISGGGLAYRHVDGLDLESKYMSYTVEFDDKASDYRMVVIRLTDSYCTHRCAYVSVPIGHPWHGKGYDHEVSVPDLATVPVNETDPVGTFLACCKGAQQDEEAAKLPISYLAQVHGGITYAGGNNYPVEGPSWWFGFDAAHCDDDRENGGRPLEYMVAECKKLRGYLKDATAEPAREQQEEINDIIL